MEEKIIALSAFFHTNDTITDIMSSRATKKSATTKPLDLFVKKGAVANKKVAEKKPKKKAVSSSEESEESSEDEPPKKSKKKVVEKKPKKKVASSSEESEESSEDEIVIEETAPKKESVAVPNDGIFKLGEGLVAIAEQLAVSNANNTKILDMLAEVLVRLEVHDHKDEVGSDLLATVDDVVKRGESIAIGTKTGMGATHYFTSVDHLKDNMGMFATQDNFTKSITSRDDEVEEDDAEEVTVGVA